MILCEIIHTDCPSPPFREQFFHCPPRAEYVVVWLMNHIQIKIVQPQFFQCQRKAALCSLIADVRDPQLCGNEQIFSWHSAAANGPANRFFIAIGSSGVDQAIA